MKKRLPTYTLKFVDEPLFQGHEFDYYNDYLKRDKPCITINHEGMKSPVYTPQLTLILTTNKIKAWNRDKQKKDVFNGINYLGPFFDGFQKGLRFFDKEYKVGPEVLYGVNGDVYIRNLHEQYFHSGKGFLTGWNTAIISYPLVISPEVIHDHGYYTAIVSCVKDLKEKHPQLFQKFHFDECADKGKYIHKGAPKPDFEFDDLFYDEKYIEPCIDVLRQVDPPLIGKKLNFLGKNKGAMCLWITELKKNFIEPRTNKEYTKLLNTKFSKLNMTPDGSHFNAESTRAKDLYALDFKQLLSEVS